MTLFLTCFVIIFGASTATAAFSNPNSILIGERAAGMGGAYTALSNDASAAGFYNPATLVRIPGNSVSASATLFNKFDTAYGEGSNILDAGERVNRGFFRTIPSAIGNVYKWKDWAFGFNIIVPDYDFFSGNIANSQNAQSFLTYTDESLWSGLVASYKINETQSLGVTLYYTARSLIRSTQDRTIVSGSHEILTSEEKSIKHNGILAVFGYLWKITKKLTLGVSVRPPAINISGEGAYYKSTTDTNNLPSQITQYKSTNAFTYIPPKYSVGLGVEASKQFTLSFDGTFYSSFGYLDMASSDASDSIEHKDTWNIAMGGEYRFKDPNFNFRFGLFTNNSTHPNVDNSPSRRVGDHINLVGFSSNISFNVSENSSYTVGGFYYGGDGYSSQRVGNQLTRLEKNHHVFTLLISTSYRF